MYTMREGASATMALNLMMFVYLRIVHRPAAADVAADLKLTIDDVEAKASVADAARRQRMLTTAEIRYLDEELDVAVSRYVKALMALLPEGRADARYLAGRRHRRCLARASGANPLPPSPTMRVVPGSLLIVGSSTRYRSRPS